MRALKFLNQRGMTLPEIMVAAGLMGAVALITAKLMGDQNSNQAYLKAKSEVSSTVTRVESLLNNPQQCTSIMQGHRVSSVGYSHTNLTYTTPLGASVDVIKEGDYPAYEIESGGIKLQTSIYGASVTDLVLTFKMKGKSFFNGSEQKEIIKRIPFVTQLDVGSRIMACGPVLGDSELVGQKKMCESLGGAAEWTVPDGPCKLKEVKCPWGEVATKMTSLGGIVCTPLKNQIPLSEVFDLNGVDCTGKPNVQIVNVGGKLKVTCTAGGCTPVNGGWSAWSNPAWGPCVSGNQTRTVTRTCTSPTPNACGAPCTPPASQVENQACVTLGLSDGTMCSFDLFHANNCNDCTNVPNVSVSKCCRPGNPASHMLYQCGGTEMQACAVEDQPNPTSLEVPQYAPAPPTWECDI